MGISSEQRMNEVSKINNQRKIWLNLDSFRRIQLAMLVWGLILITGGFLHNNFGSSKAWGAAIMFSVWVGLMIVGILANYLIAPGFLNSSSIFIWLSLLAVGFGITWLILFPLNMEGKLYISSIWHLVFAVSYFLTGYYFDRRFFWLTLWEISWALIMYLMLVPKVMVITEISTNQGYTLGFSSGIPLLICALPFWKELRYEFYTRKEAN